MAEFEERHVHKNFRIIGYNNGQRLELSSNLPTLEIAEKLRQDYYIAYPFLDPIQIEEYSTYMF